MIAASLCYTTDNEAPAQIAAISLGGCFVLEAQMESREKTARNRDIRQEREAGKTLNELSAKYGITKERVRQICLKQLQEPDDDIWFRMKKVAIDNGYESVLVRTYHIVKRGLYVGLGAWIPFEKLPRERWHELRNCGKKCLELLELTFVE